MGNELAEDLQAKYNEAVTENQWITKAFDLETVCDFFTEYYADQRMEWETDEEEDFFSFWENLCHLPHIQEKAVEGLKLLHDGIIA